MKRYIFLTLAICIVVGCQYGCTSKRSDTSEKVIYYCPMHPNYTSNKPGDCPICSMKYVPKETTEKATYYCPMHPTYTSDKSGDCPICSMKYVLKETMKEAPESSSASDRLTINISPVRQQLIGVKTEVIKKQPIHKMIRAVGIVDYDESKIVHVNTKFEGWIDELYVNYTGQYVKKGQPLFRVYSPELVSAQKEYLLALETNKSLQHNTSKIDTVAKSILESSWRKLKILGINDDQISSLENTGKVEMYLTIYSPIDGFVIQKNVFKGHHFLPGDDLYMIADLSNIWVLAQIYEYELPFIKLGQEVRISSPYIPEKTFTGTVSYIYPGISSETRTIKIRIELSNPDFVLKPGMYVNVEIHVDCGTKIAVPIGAVLDADERKIVFVDLGDGYFEPREIKVDVYGEGMYEVIEGVKEGEKVVTSANFFIDSESSLEAALSKMGAGSKSSESTESPGAD
ncbi:MAG TPA: efflux RND transporter periplasmic adaptor subunit [Candidatus Wunengus sp. YC63]|uniref:efflux RND transporter periplasmic adaptor subunit n=1 Tax=unclassified Candidatus Wunengus TaxID=3367695 RepID=UPI002713B383|nr:efflux RND transporter periplasmic adaptor subunit [Candidatus Brocadiales bacterium]